VESDESESDIYLSECTSSDGEDESDSEYAEEDNK
jgi:hypothetical protein